MKDDTALISNISWHAWNIQDIDARLNTSSQGLSEQSALSRLEQYGANRLPEPNERGAMLRFLSQFHHVLIYVLMVAGVVTALLEHTLDASVIFGVVLVNAAIGFIQEGKAESALKAIRQMLSANAMVLRDGQQRWIAASALVPGDVVLLQSGDRIPADMRLFRVKGLQVQESALTGESIPVEKQTHPVAESAVLGDRICMVFSGTLVTHGQGAGLVVETGERTELGRISRLVAEVKPLSTPLLRQMDDVARRLTVGILLLAVATSAFGVWVRDYAVSDMFLAAVSLAVAAIPEGLPAIMTITLAIGVQRMAVRNAIIRQLPAVETLGEVSVICTDKTGTLTRNEMTVRSIVTSDGVVTVTGTGYDPHGAMEWQGKVMDAESNAVLWAMLRGAVLCNDSSLQYEDTHWKVHGDPMEGALLVAGMKAGMDVAEEWQRYPRTDLIPFESEHRFMATLHHNHAGEGFIFIKGAPEQVLSMCSMQHMLAGDMPMDRMYWMQAIHNLANQGQRVLAIAAKTTHHAHTELTFEDVDNDLIMLGLVGLIDPPRDEAIAAIALCARAGIRVKMITGDHGATASAIARQVHLRNTVDVITGEDLDAMDKDVLRRRVQDVDIYARVNPEHKLLLVEILQEHHQVVAMTGDGVNDAPALKRADVGMAMGLGGTEAAKEAAEMVLTDDNFASISYAVEEGRTVYDNLRKALIFILPTNGGEALVILMAIVLGFQYVPLTPAQILWVNMITAVTLALSLAFEPPEHDVMHRKPRRPEQSILGRDIVWRIVYVAIMLTLGTIGLFLWYVEQGVSIEYARTIAVNALVMFELFYLFNSRYLTASVLNWKGLTGNPYVLIAVAVLLLFQMGFTYVESMQHWFGTAAIDANAWLSIVCMAALLLLLVEAEKWWMRRYQRRGHT